MFSKKNPTLDPFAKVRGPSIPAPVPDVRDTSVAPYTLNASGKFELQPLHFNRAMISEDEARQEWAAAASMARSGSVLDNGQGISTELFALRSPDAKNATITGNNRAAANRELKDVLVKWHNDFPYRDVKDLSVETYSILLEPYFRNTRSQIFVINRRFTDPQDLEVAVLDRFDIRKSTQLEAGKVSLRRDGYPIPELQAVNFSKPPYAFFYRGLEPANRGFATTKYYYDQNGNKRSYAQVWRGYEYAAAGDKDKLNSVELTPPQHYFQELVYRNKTFMQSPELRIAGSRHFTGFNIQVFGSGPGTNTDLRFLLERGTYPDTASYEQYAKNREAAEGLPWLRPSPNTVMTRVSQRMRAENKFAEDGLVAGNGFGANFIDYVGPTIEPEEYSVPQQFANFLQIFAENDAKFPFRRVISNSFQRYWGNHILERVRDPSSQITDNTLYNQVAFRFGSLQIFIDEEQRRDFIKSGRKTAAVAPYVFQHTGYQLTAHERAMNYLYQLPEAEELRRGIETPWGDGICALDVSLPPHNPNEMSREQMQEELVKMVHSIFDNYFDDREIVRKPSDPNDPRPGLDDYEITLQRTDNAFNLSTPDLDPMDPAYREAASGTSERYILFIRYRAVDANGQPTFRPSKHGVVLPAPFTVEPNTTRQHKSVEAWNETDNQIAREGEMTAAGVRPFVLELLGTHPMRYEDSVVKETNKFVRAVVSQMLEHPNERLELFSPTVSIETPYQPKYNESATVYRAIGLFRPITP